MDGVKRDTLFIEKIKEKKGCMHILHYPLSIGFRRNDQPQFSSAQ